MIFCVLYYFILFLLLSACPCFTSAGIILLFVVSWYNVKKQNKVVLWQKTIILQYKVSFVRMETLWVCWVKLDLNLKVETFQHSWWYWSCTELINNSSRVCVMYNNHNEQSHKRKKASKAFFEWTALGLVWSLCRLTFFSDHIYQDVNHYKRSCPPDPCTAEHNESFWFNMSPLFPLMFSVRVFSLHVPAVYRYRSSIQDALLFQVDLL